MKASGRRLSAVASFVHLIFFNSIFVMAFGYINAFLQHKMRGGWKVSKTLYRTMTKKAGMRSMSVCRLKTKYASCWGFLFFLVQGMLVMHIMHNIPTIKASLDVSDQNTISMHSWQYNMALHAWTLQLLNIPSNAILLVFVCPDLQCASTSMQVASCAEIKQLGGTATGAATGARQWKLIAATNSVHYTGCIPPVAYSSAAAILQPHQIVLFNNASSLHNLGHAHTDSQFELRLRVLSINTFESSNIFSVQSIHMSFNLTIPQSTLNIISVQNECAARFLRTPFQSVLTAYPQPNGLRLCLWKCQDSFVRHPWNAVPQSSLIPEKNYTYTPSCVPLPPRYVAIEFDFHLYVNVQPPQTNIQDDFENTDTQDQNMQSMDFSEAFYTELDALAEHIRQNALVQGFVDPMVVLKIKLSFFDTNQFHEILYGHSIKQLHSTAHEFYPVQMRRRLLNVNDANSLDQEQSKQTVIVQGVVIATGKTVDTEPEMLYDITIDAVSRSTESFEFESIEVEGIESTIVKVIVHNAQVAVSGSTRHKQDQDSHTLFETVVPLVVVRLLDFCIICFVVYRCGWNRHK